MPSVAWPATLARPLRCPPVRWKGPAFALLGAAAIAGIAIGFRLGGGSNETITNLSTGTGTTSAGGTSQGATTGTGTGTTRGTTLPQRPQRVRLGHRLVVATVDDAVKQADPKLAASLMKVCHDAGFDAVMVSSIWTPGARAPSAQERLTLGNVVKAADTEGMQVFVFFLHGLIGGAVAPGPA